MLPDTLAQARRDYMENQAMITSPTEVVQALYQIAIDNVRAALNLLKSGDAFARARVVTKAEEAVDELILSIDHSVGAPFTRTLEELYRYILNQLVIGHARQSEQAFRDALGILESLADTWSKVRANLAAEAQANERQPLGAAQTAQSKAGEAEEPVSEGIAGGETPADDAHDVRRFYAAYSAGSPAFSGRDWSA